MARIKLWTRWLDKAKIYKISFLIVTNFFHFTSTSQVNNYAELKRFAVSIGTVDAKTKKFFDIGSGFMTYLKKDTSILHCVITAGHVVRFFESNNIPFYVRPSWADTITTTSYFGIKIPLLAQGRKTFIKSGDSTLDIGCIMVDEGEDSVAFNYYKNISVKVFPYTHIANPELGESVIILGYPGHVENTFNKINYSVCTVKSGIVSWINSYKINTNLDKYILIESNATYGNSGGPVFSAPEQGGSLVGIIIGGFDDDPLTVQVNGKEFRDSTKNPYYVVPKSGVTTILKAEYIRKFMEGIVIVR